jgi:hypothetical protein
LNFSNFGVMWVTDRELSAGLRKSRLEPGGGSEAVALVHAIVPVGDYFVGCFNASDGEQLGQRDRQVPALPAAQQRSFGKSEVSPFPTGVHERSQSRHREIHIPVRSVVLVPKVPAFAPMCFAGLV